jgi:hypothetical protein
MRFRPGSSDDDLLLLMPWPRRVVKGVDRFKVFVLELAILQLLQLETSQERAKSCLVVGE